jgi:hypothetical protein
VVKEDTRAVDMIGWLDTAVRDVRYAVRLLRKSPGFTLASILTLALGVIGTTLVFAAYSAIALRTVAVRDTKSLTVLKREFRKGGTSTAFSEREFRNLSEQNRDFEGVIAETGYDTVLAQLADTGQKNFAEPRQVIIKLVSENYFSVLGVDTITGRIFTEEERGDTAVAILSYSSRQRRFRGDPAVLGRSVLLSGTPITIIGIAPRDFIGTGLPPIPPDLWIPLGMQTQVEPGRDLTSYEDEPRLRVVGRLRPGVSARHTWAELTAMVQRFETSQGLEQATSAIESDPPAYFIEKGNPQFQSLAALREQLAGKFSALPEVTGVAFADHVPLLGAGTTTVNELGKAAEHAFENHISPGFFSVFGISVLRGRDFTAADGAGRAPVVIVTESTARHLCRERMLSEKSSDWETRKLPRR